MVLFRPIHESFGEETSPHRFSFGLGLGSRSPFNSSLGHQLFLLLLITVAMIMVVVIIAIQPPLGHLAKLQSFHGFIFLR